MSTARIYYTDAYRTSFDANVTEVRDGGARVYLDRTAFYPTSGGQQNDLGMLDGIEVIDVIDEGEEIAHLLASPIAPDRLTVSGEIDWKRRFDHMQQHTGQHLLSALFEERYGCATLSVHFGADYSTLDVAAESISHHQLVEAEQRANELVLEGRPVAVTFEDAATAAGLRKVSERSGVLRIVSIDGLDRSACGGTHVRSTAEIGPILLRGTEKVRGGARIEFVCGLRAVGRARRDFELLTTIAASLSASIDDAASVVATQSERFRESDASRRKLEKELATHRARQLYEEATPDSTGVRTIVLRDATDAEALRLLAQAIIALPRAVAIGTIQSPSSVLLASSEDSAFDAGRTLKEALSAVGGRGGGSPRIAQGSVPDRNAAESVLDRVVNRGG